MFKQTKNKTKKKLLRTIIKKWYPAEGFHVEKSTKNNNEDLYFRGKYVGSLKFYGILSPSDFLKRIFFIKTWDSLIIDYNMFCMLLNLTKSHGKQWEYMAFSNQIDAPQKVRKTTNKSRELYKEELRKHMSKAIGCKIKKVI